ncbi:hypothetical protein OSTOST_03296 [Ostertagia ostertagi]
MKVEDVQHALREMNIPMPIGALTRPQPSMRQLRMPGGEQLYVREDMDVDVQSISQPAQTKIPVKRHIRVHWIRVDNEEEPPQEKKAKKTSQGSGMSSTDLPAALRKRVTLPAELAAPSVSFRMAAQGIPKKEQILVKPSFLEPLSVEQQIYLKEIVEACVGQDDRKRQQALQSLERDTGIQELLPRLSRLIHTSLHEFLPSLMSCMLGRILCTRPDSDNHWALRDFAGKTLITIIKDHGTKETRRRSFRAVKRIFDDPSSSYSMIYGTITTLLEFASPVELIRLHPRIMALLERTRTAAATSADQQERIEAHKLHAALTKHEPALRRLIKQAAQASKKDHPKGYV